MSLAHCANTELTYWSFVFGFPRLFSDLYTFILTSEERRYENDFFFSVVCTCMVRKCKWGIFFRSESWRQRSGARSWAFSGVCPILWGGCKCGFPRKVAAITESGFIVSLRSLISMRTMVPTLATGACIKQRLPPEAAPAHGRLASAHFTLPSHNTNNSCPISFFEYFIHLKDNGWLIKVQFFSDFETRYNIILTCMY